MDQGILAATQPETLASAITERTAAEVASRHFGVEGSASRLRGEKDANFLITAPSGNQFVMKLSVGHQAEADARFQSSIIEHIASTDTELCVPSSVLTVDRQYTVNVPIGGERSATARLATYVDGQPIGFQPPGQTDHRRLGRTLGALNAALERHQAPHPVLPTPWDMQQMVKLLRYTESIPDRSARRLATHYAEAFLTDTLPRFGKLPAQTIHNDANRDNLLIVDNSPLYGVIDFGDAVLGPRVQDLAVLCAYHCDAVDWIDAVTAIVDGFQSVCPIGDELDLLGGAIAARHALTLIITHQRALLDPANRPYIMRNEPHARVGLANIDRVSPEFLNDHIRARTERTH